MYLEQNARELARNAVNSYFLHHLLYRRKSTQVAVSYTDFISDNTILNIIRTVRMCKQMTLKSWYNIHENESRWWIVEKPYRDYEYIFICLLSELESKLSK